MPYGFDDVILAELQAVYDNMALCVANGITGVVIEVDAAKVIHMVKDSNQVHWRYVSLLRKVKALMPLFDSISLIYREQNMTADKLARSAIGASDKKEFFSISEIPREIQKIIFLDRIGLLNFCLPCN